MNCATTNRYALEASLIYKEVCARSAVIYRLSA